jgi:hypothetical protein
MTTYYLGGLNGSYTSSILSYTAVLQQSYNIREMAVHCLLAIKVYSSKSKLYKAYENKWDITDVFENMQHCTSTLVHCTYSTIRFALAQTQGIAHYSAQLNVVHSCMAININQCSMLPVIVFVAKMEKRLSLNVP